MGWIGRLVPVLMFAWVGTTAGLSAAGWFVGLTCSATLAAVVGHGLARFRHVLGPADVVTLVRASLACVAAALVWDSFLEPVSVRALVSLAVTALVLDAVDGLVARRTGTMSRFGARF